MKYRPLFQALILVLTAAVLRFWIAPVANSLPMDYASQTQYAAVDRFRQSLDDEWHVIHLVVRQVNQTLSLSNGAAIIQGDLVWVSDQGEVIFETSYLYGVDRYTFQNLAGYGDFDRSGQFFFPQHTRPETYIYWDPMFIGPRTAVFDRVESLDGLEVYVFQFSGTGMNETDGYSALPDVPERYDVHTDGQGWLWIEPVSGLIVDYEEQGVSYFANPVSGVIIASFNEWSDQYTPETRAAQLARARWNRLRILALETWLPIALMVIAAVLLLNSSKPLRPGKRRTKG